MPAPLTGQVSVTGTAQALSATPVACVAFTIKNPRSNGHAIYIGPAGVTASTGFQLDTGDEFQYERSTTSSGPNYQLSVSDFYVVGTPGDSVTWFASP